jgi:hypothetical protein
MYREIREMCPEFDNDGGSRMRGGLRQHFVPSRPNEQRASFLGWRGGGSSGGSGGSDAPSWRKDQQKLYQVILISQEKARRWKRRFRVASGLLCFCF